MLNYPDPFIHPNAYWQLTHDDNRLTERQKRQMLKAVGMDYDTEPKKTKQEMELSAQPKRTETRLFLISTSNIGKHTKQGLKRKYEQMEWQIDEIRFFSNSGVYRVGFGNRDKGGVLMTQQMMWCLIVPAVIWVSIKIISDAYELYYTVRYDKDKENGAFDDE